LPSALSPTPCATGRRSVGHARSHTKHISRALAGPVFVVVVVVVGKGALPFGPEGLVLLCLVWRSPVVGSGCVNVCGCVWVCVGAYGRVRAYAWMSIHGLCARVSVCLKGSVSGWEGALTRGLGWRRKGLRMERFAELKKNIA